MKSRIKTLIRLLLIGVAAWALLTAFSIYSYAQVDETTPADAAVVLGAAVYRERPSPVFRERINHAIALYQAGTVEALIFTGGVGRNDDRAESEAAREYAQEAGVPADDIYIETISTDTYGNLEQAQIIVGQLGFESVLIVSDPLHMARAMAITEDLGINAHSSPTTTSRYESLYSQIWFLVREVLFNMSYTLLGAD